MFYTVVNGESIEYDDIYDGRLSNMPKGIDWQAYAKGLLKAELKRRHVTYGELAERLGELGVHETAENIANKISRGSFTAVFLLQCLFAVGCASVHLGEPQ